MAGAHLGVPALAAVMVVNDTIKDPRFKGALFVPWPPLTRFYAAAPVVSTRPAGAAGRSRRWRAWGALHWREAHHGPPWQQLSSLACSARLQVCSEGRVLGSLEVLDSRPRTFHAGKPRRPCRPRWPCRPSNAPCPCMRSISAWFWSKTVLLLLLMLLQARWKCCGASAR